MDRPKLISRLTFRLPEELLADILAAATRRRCSANEVVVNALENEFARVLTYHLHYYSVLRPLALQCQQNRVLQTPVVSDMLNSGPQPTLTERVQP